MISPDLKAWIDKATYEELLRKWRFAPAGSPLFTGEVGEYYKERMTRLKAIVGDEEHVRVSKAIGWGDR